MEKIIKKRISTIIFVGILAVGLFMGSVAYTKEKHRETEDENQQEITITKIDDSEADGAEPYDTSKAYYSDYNDSGLETYIITSVFNESDIYVQELRELGYCEYVFENDDKMIEVKMTPEERSAWIARVEDTISNKLAEIEETGMHSFVLSEDCKTLVAEIEKIGSIEAFGQDMILLTYNAEIYQILNGEEEWSLNIIVKNADTGKELVNVYFPQEKFEITPEMWDE